MSKKSYTQGENSENYFSPGSSCLHLLTRGACNHQMPSVKICKIRMKPAWSWNMFRHVGFEIFNLSIALFTSKGLNDWIVKEKNPGQPEQQSGEPTLLFLILFNTSKKEQSFTMLNHEKASFHENNYSYLKFAGTMLHIRFRTTKAVWVIVRAATWKKKEKKKSSD